VDSKQASGVTAGLVLMVIGLILLGDQFNLHVSWSMRRLWPLILVAVGAGNLLIRENRGFGVWMVLVGGLLLMHMHRILLVRDSWPLFVVALGLSLVIGAWSRPAVKLNKEG
jgi:hypothetical protein